MAAQGTIPQFRRFLSAQRIASLRPRSPAPRFKISATWRSAMNGIIYLVGLVVVVLAILSFLGLR
jgi:hypothetical protein